MICNLIRGFVLFLSALNALSPEVQDQLREYIHEGDEVKLLEPKDPKGFLAIKNYANPYNQNGTCFGITQAQLALLNIKFEEKGTRDSDEKIISSIKLAARGDTPQVIHGVSKEALIQEMLNPKSSSPLKAAIDEIQRTHLVQLKSSGELSIEPGSQVQASDSLSFTMQDIKAVHAQAKEFMESIDRGLPIWGSSFPIERDSDASKMIKSTGHAFVIVGYIKKKGAKVPDRLIIRDPNYPDRLRVITATEDKNKKLNWNDLSTASGASPTNPVPVVLGSQNLNSTQQQNLIAAFSTSVSNADSTPSQIAESKNNCAPKSDVSKIFSAAAH